ncbi:hypothetical protein T459_22439 [Capsicum annuum]|uniref:Uncharacterized protein n=1 Tax=Capsicum annuum TaxID=4072 RepID=A0A2G2YPM0_CAPAN|nr:putative cytochrome 93A1 [Capsicum annuum]PHT71654.1 hypothetical protein T459_22439 [Capsicum annuum]
MSLKLHHHHHHHNLPSSNCSSSPWPSVKAVRNYYLSRKVVGLDHLIYNQCNTRRRCHTKLYLLKGGNRDLSCTPDSMKHRINPRTSRILHLLPFASAEDGVSVNGSSRSTTSSDMEQMRRKLDLSLQGEESGSGLVQSLHDAARVIELGLRQQGSLSRVSWFSTAWLGGDRTGWIKVLSYQASVYSLLQAAIEISSRGDERDNDINVFTQRSLSRQCAPLESVIRDSLLAKQPEAYDWFWSEQIPAVVTTFVNHFEKDQRFAAATAETRKQPSISPRNASDASLIMLALICIAAIMKLGAAKLLCTQFSSLVPETLGRLMDMLVEFVSLRQAYHSVKPIGLRREFLVHFGSRAAACRVQTDSGTEEVIFWVSLVQKQLQRAIDRERIWSRLTTSESIEVLEKDLAIFGFFIALGRSTKAFLYENGFDTLDEPIEELIRYLIGGSVLYYPQLASISSYQLYVEVVCEELDWLPFYPGITANSIRNTGHKSKQEVPPNLEAISLVLDVCSYWIQSFIKYSKWLENPSHVKAARFVSTGHNKLKKCREDLGIEKTCTGAYSQIKKETDSFDKALESVEEALVRLEVLLQELHMSSDSSQKENLKAACSDLERIRRIKKEAEFLEVSFRTKAAFLQQEEDATISTPSSRDEKQFSKHKDKKDGKNRSGNNRIQGLWSFVGRRPSKSADQASSTPNDIGGDGSKQPSESTGIMDSKPNEVRRFELLRSELMELEKRVQRSADQYEYEEEESQNTDRISTHSAGAERTQLVLQKKKESVIEKSLDKLKETSTDVWQGTQLLAIDVAAALGLLRRSIVGDELTEKEKQALRRTLTDLASVVPIGFLMLLPVTAVGHAAILAAIQRYMPSLIPSTYGPDRLDLLRQLEKVKEMETEVNPTEKADE